MKTTAGAWLLGLGPALLVGCADDAPESSKESDFVVLEDDGTDDSDVIMGEPGAYALTPRGTSDAPYAVIDVPAGYASFGFWAVWPSSDEDDGDGDDEFSTVEYWAVHGVYDDPCRWEGTAPEIGPTVDDLVAALSEQRYTEVTAEPEPVSLGGHDGVVISVKVPADLDTSPCTEGRYMFWQGSPGDAHHQAPVGTTERMWILDVDGQRVVLGTAATAGVPASEVAELTAMVESVRFVERS